MQIYYVNVAARADRRAFMEAQFERLGLGATRIEAVTPQDLAASDVDRYCDPRRARWLTTRELSCTLSHVAACKAMLAARKDWALIFEDDVVLSARLPAFLADFAVAPPAVDLLRLETTLDRLRLKSQGDRIVTGVALFQPYSWASGAGGYLLSARAARSIVNSPDIWLKPLDELLFNPYQRLPRSMVLRQANPALCVQTDRLHAPQVPVLGSDLHEQRMGRPQRIKPYFWRRLPGTTIGWINRDIVVATQKAWHQYLRGASKQEVPFAPD